MDRIRIGVIGCGYWGPNLVRNFSSLSRSTVLRIADLNKGRLDYMSELYPAIETTQNADNIIKADDIDVVCIATPIATHYKFAFQALEQKKHVLIEKPFVRTSKEAIDLIKKAKSLKRVLMVDHTFIYSKPVREVKKMIAEGILGKILCLYSVRVNLGLFRKDINVVWDLAPHDISIANYLLDQKPQSISVTGRKSAGSHVEDVAFASLIYPNDVLFHLHMSWLDPRKIRQITIIGDKKMVVYDDLNPNEPLKIFDKGVETPPYYDSFGEFKMIYRQGDIVSPHIAPSEPLRNLCEHFLNCIANGTEPLTGGIEGLEITRVLESAQTSVETGGKSILIER